MRSAFPAEFADARSRSVPALLARDMAATHKAIRDNLHGSNERFSLMTEEQRRIRERIDNLERRDKFDSNVSRQYREAFVAWLHNGTVQTSREPGISPEQRSVLFRGEQRDMGAGNSPTGGRHFPEA